MHVYSYSYDSSPILLSSKNNNINIIYNTKNNYNNNNIHLRVYMSAYIKLSKFGIISKHIRYINITLSGALSLLCDLSYYSASACDGSRLHRCTDTADITNYIYDDSVNDNMNNNNNNNNNYNYNNNNNNKLTK